MLRIMGRMRRGGIDPIWLEYIGRMRRGGIDPIWLEYWVG